MSDPSKFESDVGWKQFGDMWLPSKTFPPSCIEDAANFEFREGDVIVQSYPRTGTCIVKTKQTVKTKQKKNRNHNLRTWGLTFFHSSEWG